MMMMNIVSIVILMMVAVNIVIMMMIVVILAILIVIHSSGDTSIGICYVIGASFVGSRRNRSDDVRNRFVTQLFRKILRAASLHI